MIRTLGGKLIISVAGIFVIAIVIVMTYNYKTTSIEVQNLYKTIQETVLDASYTTINITMNIEAKQHLDAISRSILELDKHDIISQRRVLLRAEELIKYPSIYIVYEDDGSLIVQDYDTSKSVQSLSPNFDNEGDLRTRDWYQKTKQQQQGIITPTYINQGGIYAGKMMSTATYPLIKNGRFIGVIGIDFFVENFQERFENFRREELPSLDVYITDSTGNIFSHRDLAIVADTSLSPQEVQLSSELKKSTNGEFVYFDSHGQERLGVYRQFPFGWTIVVSSKTEDYTNAINKYFFYSVVISILILGIGVFLLFLFIRKLIAPVEKIKNVLLHFFKYINY
ncbi:cache domain-containing protein, partial [Campylobacter sp. MIT 21-1685]|uniref:PDC sensor domain-containing protein n=1 Tax=unclassified Campylobacter TaxID=2593542 RepID=UPI00224A721E